PSAGFRRPADPVTAASGRKIRARVPKRPFRAYITVTGTTTGNRRPEIVHATSLDPHSTPPDPAPRPGLRPRSRGPGPAWHVHAPPVGRPWRPLGPGRGADPGAPATARDHGGRGRRAPPGAGRADRGRRVRGVLRARAGSGLPALPPDLELPLPDRDRGAGRGVRHGEDRGPRGGIPLRPPPRSEERRVGEEW